MEYIKSPLNYIGGKYKILDSIFQILPQKIDTFVDLFAGGFNVGINVDAKKIICNDHISYLIELFEYLSSNSTNNIIDDINNIIKEFDLTKQNVEGYNSLRERYNQKKEIMDFLVLTFYSFNHQIRFNNNHQFNTPFGKERSSYNPSIERNLICFCNALRNKIIEYLNHDFLSVDLSGLDNDSLVYCDPPYLITNGSYNDGKRGFKDWTLTEEKQLLDLLDRLNSKGIKFALSNVLYHKGLSNDLLIEWSQRYNIHYIDKNYNNCNYHFKGKNAKTVEVIITNFESEDNS